MGSSRYLVVALFAWFLLGAIDFATDFVEFSFLRLVLLILISFSLFPIRFPLPTAVTLALHRLNEHRAYGFAFLAVLALLGYALFLSRYVRAANMGDDPVFQEVIQRTAGGCFFCFPAFGGSYFAGHNNLFLILFVPLAVFPFWWPIVHLIQSFVIVIWCRACGWAVGGNTLAGWNTTFALFLATYGQHAVFYDTRFAALALALFAIGFYLQRKRLMFASALAALPTRETAGLTLFMFGVIGVLTRPNKKLLMFIAIMGLLWWVGSYILILRLGGPIVPRFDNCLRFSANQIPDPNCLVNAVATDWPLKAAYTLSLIRYAPTLGALPSLFAALPDLAFTWLSKGNVLYSLSWHYYMQTLGILVVGAGISLRKRIPPIYSQNLFLRWILASCLWQFVTTVHPNLF